MVHLAFCLLALLGASASAQLTQAPFTTTIHPASQKGELLSEELRAVIQDLLQNTSVPGYSLAIVRPGADIDVEFGNWGNKTEDGDVVTSDTLFTLASVSKAFTATALGLLIDDFAHGRNMTALPTGVKEITWTTKVKDLLPGEWKLMDEWASEKANLRDLLSHVSGMPRHEYSYRPEDSATDLIARMRYLRPAYELREKWHYNNQPYVLATHLIAKYSGIPFTTFVSDRIFTPLYMTSTTYLPSRASATGNFTQAWASFGRRIPNWFDDAIVERLNAGPGGVISSARDMVEWVKLLLEGDGKNATGIPKEILQEVMKPSVLEGNSPFEGMGVLTYGMGWTQTTYKGHLVVQHGGSIPGISTLVTLLPKEKLGIVQLANADSKAESNIKILFMLVNTALGIHTDESELASSIRALHDLLHPARSPTVHVGLSASEGLDLGTLAGTYTDPGYGAITLCAPTSTSHHCSQVLSAFASVTNSTRSSAFAHTADDTLYASFPRVWASHLRLIRDHSRDAGKGPAFVLVPTVLFPNGYGKDTSPFETAGDEDAREGATVRFVVESGKVKGLGVTGLVGEVTERERTATSVEEGSELWFEKV